MSLCSPPSWAASPDDPLGLPPDLLHDPTFGPDDNYEVAELIWENGNPTLHGLLPSSQLKASNDTLECIVRQATRHSSPPRQKVKLGPTESATGYRESDGVGIVSYNSLPNFTPEADSSYFHGGINAREEEEEKRATNSTRRRRTPAVHNLSERKRRERINEKMRALQKLVPNASKTDKASMLDEVIQYMKQLQAQIYMMDAFRKTAPAAVQHQLQMSLLAARMGMFEMQPMMPFAPFVHPAVISAQPSRLAVPPMAPPRGPVSDLAPHASISQAAKMDSYRKIL